MKNLPPGPARSSPLGIMPDFARDPVSLTMQAFKQYGDIVLLPGPFGQSAYLINDPDLIHAVLVTYADRIEKPAALKRIFRSSFGNGLFFSEGSFWKRQRKLAQPAFHHTRIQSYAEAMVQRAQQLLANWQAGQIRDIRQDMSATTLKIVVDALFHSTVEEETEQIYAAMTELGQVIGQQSTNPLLAFVPDWVPLPSMRRKRRASATLDAIVYRFIDQRRAAQIDAGDLLSMLMLAEDEAGQRMTDRQLHAEVMTIFIAGHETTALALTWAFVLLAQHPAAETKLQAEIDRVLAGRAPTLIDLPNLPYTEMVIKETLRLYPPAWLLLRQALEEFPIGPYTIPKGKQIWISPYILHRHPRFYDQPEAFQPERFGPDAAGTHLESRLPKFAYLPFGGGPRVCIGNAFALMEAQLIMATIVQRYRLIMPPDSNIKLRVGPTLGFENGAPLQVMRRT
jgi:cytochrome P450